MNDFLECPERTQFSDEAYSALGRALFVCQEFESKCRGLALFFTTIRAHRMGEANPAEDREFQAFVSELWKRSLGTNVKILRIYGLPKSATRALHKAAGARNRVAHDITHGIHRRIEGTAGRAAFLNELAKRVRAVADADLLVGVLIQSVNRDAFPTPAFVINYSNKVVKWVTEVFDE